MDVVKMKGLASIGKGKKSKRELMAEAQRKEELELEKLVLGDSEGVLGNLDKWQAKNEEEDSATVYTRKKTKRSVSGGQKAKASASTIDDDDDDVDEASKSGKRKQPVWRDDDDGNDTDQITNILIPKRNKWGKVEFELKATTQKNYKAELERRFVSVMGTPSWATLDKKQNNSDEDDAEGILKRVGNFTKESDTLMGHTLSVKPCTNLAWGGGRKGAIKALEFHPRAQVALTCNSKSVVLRQVDGTHNPVIQEVNVNFGVTCAHFTRDGERFLVSSKSHPYCYIYDMMAGKLDTIKGNKFAGKYNMEKFYMSSDNQLIVAPGISGYIHFLMTKTNEHLFSYKMNSDLRGVAFNADSSKMYTHSVDGEIYAWDMRQRKCLRKFNDDGCIHGTSIALSSSEQFLATGSDTGVVNVYDISNTMQPAARPCKTFLNLTTSITELKFNSTSEILAIVSSEKKAAVRLVHCASMTVFSDFPSNEWKLEKISALDMSPNSGFLAMGTDEGFAKLFRLNYYGNY